MIEGADGERREVEGDGMGLALDPSICPPPHSLKQGFLQSEEGEDGGKSFPVLSLAHPPSDSDS